MLKERRGNSYVLLRLFGTMDRERYESLKRTLSEVEEELERWAQFLIRK
ncbi:MAG: hypothetical protein RMI85_00240 [Candidatus Korarchaeum sp.]|nr:hypothetical protein [Candidatus Korarchaeum sp.]